MTLTLDGSLLTDDAELTKRTVRMHRVLDPLHSLIYFAPEAEPAFVAVGLRPGRMPYFASRSAPFGPVGYGAVAATFYNFNPEMVQRVIPRAWTLASPEQVLATRLEVADASLRRLLGEELIDSPEMAEAAELARTAATGLCVDGRALYAATAELDWPEVPHLVLWHAVTLLREWRGDAHVAVLVAHGMSGLDALVSHTATGRGFTEPAAKLTRGWSDEQWAAALDRLRERGLLDADGQLTDAGQALRESIEELTNRVSVAPAVALGADGAQRLTDIGRVFSKTAIGNGAFPGTVIAAAAG